MQKHLTAAEQHVQRRTGQTSMRVLMDATTGYIDL